MIRANQKYIDTSSIAHLLVNGEKNADTINFEVDRFYHGIDLSNCDFILRAVNENQNLIDQTLNKTISNDIITLEWIINEYFTAVDGKLLLEIRAVQDESLILKYVMSPIYVKSSATGEGLPSLDTVEKALDDMQKLLEQAQDIAVKVPYIDGGTWWVWNVAQNQYVDTGISAQGEQGENGQDGKDGTNGVDGKDGEDGLSAYEIWLSLGNVGTETDFLNSLKGQDGANGVDGSNGQNGLSAYEIWINQGNTGTETDFLNSLKGENGADGQDGTNGVSPTVTVAESTENSYILTITDVNGSFNTPNLMGTSGSGTAITVDTELSETSENPVQNAVITQNLGYVWTSITDLKSTNTTLQSQINALNDLINGISSETTITTLFDNANYLKYLNWNFLVDQWGSSIYSFEQAIQHTSTICSDAYDYQLRLSPDMGWSANVQFICLTPVEINSNSRFLIKYGCSTTGSNVTVEVLTSADFTSSAVANFEDIPSFYADEGTYMSVNLFLDGVIESGTYYLKFSYTTVNPVFLIKSIEVIT